MRGQTERIAAVMTSSLVAPFAKFVAVMVFLLICAGALVTGNKASLTDLTWPTFRGQVVPSHDTWQGIVAYEDAHRIIAGTTAVLTVVLAFWLQRRDPRRWVRLLGWYAVATVVAQALVGGVIIKLLRPMPVSVLHACLAQAFFCLTVTIALVTSGHWSLTGSLIDREGNVSLQRELKIATGIVFVQLLVGAGVRHSGQAFVVHLLMHIAMAVAVIFAVVWLALRIYREYRDVTALRRPMHLALVLVGVQLILGVFAAFINRARIRPDFQPPLWQAYLSTAHVAVGALILATVLVLTLRAHHLLLGAEKYQCQVMGMGKVQG